MFKTLLDETIKKVYLQAFRAANYNQAAAAKKLGVSRGTFRTKMEKWGELSSVLKLEEELWEYLMPRHNLLVSEKKTKKLKE